MGRRHKERRVQQLPPITYFKPQGVPLCDIDEISLNIEEMEAIRLADYEQLDQVTAAISMDVSSPTFNRILAGARKKVAEVLWRGKALRIEGGSFRLAQTHQLRHRHFPCHNCLNKLSNSCAPECNLAECPKYQATTITPSE